jgi:hypothetical protein
MSPVAASQDPWVTYTGREAVAWFIDNRGPFAPHAFDATDAALREFFEDQRHVQSYLWASQPPFRLNHLFLAVSGSPADEDDWERLLAVHVELVRYFDSARNLADFSLEEIERVRRSFHVVLSPEGSEGPPLIGAAAEWGLGR